MECEQSSTFDKERYGWGWTKLINDWHVSYCVSLRSIGFGLFSFGFVLVLFFNFLNFSFFFSSFCWIISLIANQCQLNSDRFLYVDEKLSLNWMRSIFIRQPANSVCISLHSSTSYASWTSQCFVHEPTIETKERETESRKYALCWKLNWYIHVVVIYMIMMRC